MPEAEGKVADSTPLCVDLDGTLVRSDLLHESFLELIRTSPWSAICVPWWLTDGKAAMKHRIAEKTHFEASHLPYNKDVLGLIADAKSKGRPIVLATAAAPQVAQAVADHLGVFDCVVSSDRTTNLSSETKARRLVEMFGEKGYDYVGNSTDDLPAWRRARHGIVVSSSRGLRHRARSLAPMISSIDVSGVGLLPLIRSLRPHQWIKNVLVFAPLLAAHEFDNFERVSAAILAFVVFSLVASFGYVVNDLLDLRADRKHFRKRNRPFASGQLSVWDGVRLGFLILLVAGVMVPFLPLGFVLVVFLYFLLTLSYSVRLKRQVIVDVILLAGLYTIRIIAGAAAVDVAPSFWLLAFSMFLFLSLAMVKRYTELRLSFDAAGALPGRGYTPEDLPVLITLGAGSGLGAVMVLALYINSPTVLSLYKAPVWLWLAPPLMLYWVCRLWMKTNRGEVHDDPVVFAARDRQSIIVAAVLALIFLAATWRPF